METGQNSSEKVTINPTVQEDMSTQLLKTVEQTVAPADEASAGDDTATPKPDDEAPSATDLRGTNRDQTGPTENMATES